MFANCKEVPLQKQNIRSIISITPDRNTLIDTHERGDYMEDKTSDYVEMTNEEYREELSKLFEGVEDNMILRYFYIFVSEKIKRVPK